MSWRDRLGTYVIVTIVSVLIWYWAAAETREQARRSLRLRLIPSDPASWVVTPEEVTVNAEMEGSRLALQKARILPMPLELTMGDELPAAPGPHRDNLVEILDKALRKTGVSVVSVEPPTIDFEIDALVTVTAPVHPVLPRLQTEGAIVVDPPQAELSLPGRLRDPNGEELALEAYMPQPRLDRLEPGRTYTLSAKLRPPKELYGQKAVSIDPSTVQVTFTVRSRIEEITLPSVRVQIAGPPEDHQEYAVEIDEKDRSLRDVTIKADGALIKQIEQGDVPVVALVHLSNTDKERRVESKPVTCFLALHPDGSGTIVEAQTPDGAPPVIHLRITERAE